MSTAVVHTEDCFMVVFTKFQVIKVSYS